MKSILSLLAVIVLISQLVSQLIFQHLALADTSVESVSVPVGKAKLGVLLQAWALEDTTATQTHFNFRMRRAEFKLGGSVLENTRWFFMADPAKLLTNTAITPGNNNKILQDLGVAFNLGSPDLELIVGQFKIPNLAEGIDPSGELFFPERSLISRLYSDRREPGAMLVYKFGMFKASTMISNGQGTDVDDTSDAKDWHLRLEATPVEQLKLGAFTQAGDFNYGSRSRFGANAGLYLGDLMARAEGITAQDLGVTTNGWMLDLGYSFLEHYQLIGRWDGVAPGNLSVTPYAASLCLNLFLKKHNSKIQTAVSYLSDMAGNNGSYVASPGTFGPMLTMNFQAYF